MTADGKLAPVALFFEVAAGAAGCVPAPTRNFPPRTHIVPHGVPIPPSSVLTLSLEVLAGVRVLTAGIDRSRLPVCSMHVGPLQLLLLPPQLSKRELACAPLHQLAVHARVEVLSRVLFASTHGQARIRTSVCVFVTVSHSATSVAAGYPASAALGIRMPHRRSHLGRSLRFIF